MIGSYKSNVWCLKTGMTVLISARALWMVRSSLACPHTVVSIILLKVIRFLGNSLNFARVLEEWISTAIETAIYSDRTSLRDMEDPSSNTRISMVRICAITFWGLMKLGLYQLCFLAIVLLVEISTFSKSSLIGGETCVQIAFAIWTRLFQDLCMGPVNLITNQSSLTDTNDLYGSTKYAFDNLGCYRRNSALWNMEPHSSFPGDRIRNSAHSKERGEVRRSYWTQPTGAIPELPNLASYWDYSRLVGVELVMSKTDCGDWPPRVSS